MTAVSLCRTEQKSSWAFRIPLVEFPQEIRQASKGKIDKLLSWYGAMVNKYAIFMLKGKLVVVKISVLLYYLFNIL